MLLLLHYWTLFQEAFVDRRVLLLRLIFLGLRLLGQQQLPVLIFSVGLELGGLELVEIDLHFPRQLKAAANYLLDLPFLQEIKSFLFGVTLFALHDLPQMIRFTLIDGLHEDRDGADVVVDDIRESGLD